MSFEIDPLRVRALQQFLILIVCQKTLEYLHRFLVLILIGGKGVAFLQPKPLLKIEKNGFIAPGLSVKIDRESSGLTYFPSPFRGSNLFGNTS